MGKRQAVEYSLQVVMLNLWVVVVQSKLLCTIYKLLCLKIMSLWAKDKPLSIAYGRYTQIISGQITIIIADITGFLNA